MPKPDGLSSISATFHQLPPYEPPSISAIPEILPAGRAQKNPHQAVENECRNPTGSAQSLRSSTSFPHTSRHPFPRSQKSFQQGGHIKIRIKPWKMNAEPRRAQLNLCEVRGLRVLQSLSVARPEAHRDLGAKLNHNASARAVVIRGNGARKSSLQFPRPFFCRFEIVNPHTLSPNHEPSPMPRKALLCGRRDLHECARVHAARMCSSLEVPPALPDSSDQKQPRIRDQSHVHAPAGDRADTRPHEARKISGRTAPEHSSIFPKRLGYFWKLRPNHRYQALILHGR